ncbi:MULTISPECIES: ABC transporter permease [Bradyrhizobium]|uniref:ABC transporter permease n=3 Tax=Bradyrhizobium TaxID=374 RepID=A0AAE5X8U8_9BRAD|nr:MULTISPECIES: ABC transporter permease [Bradyrhizobium]MCG2632959.1 ABC transporter permease [Bradyrhizobium zhengyangense]MCG2645731.1 ABC transporter permease [Bradyrhizobium zhengyangense]MCG2673161.1 ABC transporter permease [Bradyrhizobium zhengyangense]MDN4988233.1 ABC transporter permease [Bradyrhizobium sp. WYCCWR 13022]MDN5006313.1 ABC transporter permease [Bradyrhizobium sp. WYCCWR 12677]
MTIHKLSALFNSDIGHSYIRSPRAVLSTLALLTLIVAALGAPLWAPQNTLDASTFDLLSSNTPAWSINEFTNRFYAFGTDDQGRDVLSATLYGTRVSLLVGLASVLVSMSIGVSLGLISGYFGGHIDAAIMRIADIQLSIPAIFIALLISGLTRSLLPPSAREALAVYMVILAIGISGWVTYARTVRGAVMGEKQREYVQAALMIGLPTGTVLVRHILPNVRRPILVIATISLALSIITEATLSYLGAGLPPTQPSLGTLIRSGQDFLFAGQWWILLFPAATLLTLALAINVLGDWFRDVINPRGI